MRAFFSIISAIGTYACIVAAGLIYGYKCAALVVLALLLAGIVRGLGVSADWLLGVNETYDQFTEALKTRGFERIEDVFAELDQLKRDRDAAVKDLVTVCRMCNICFGCKSHDDEYISNDCMDCIKACNWQWRGVQEVQHER